MMAFQFAPNTSLLDQLGFNFSKGANEFFQGQFFPSDPLPAAPVNKPGTPGNPLDTNRGTTGDIFSGFDSRLARTGTKELGNINTFTQNQNDAVRNAIATLQDAVNTNTNLFDTRRADIANTIPTNPFTDALKESLLNQIRGEIQTRLEGNRQQTASNLGARGLGVGTSASVAEAQNRRGALQTEAEATNRLNTSQLDFNTRNNLQRESLLSQIDAEQAGLTNRASELIASLQRGDLVDPQLVNNILSDVTFAQFGLDQADAILKVAQDAADSGDQQAFTAAISQLGSVFGGITGRNNVQLASSAIPALNEIFSF